MALEAVNNSPTSPETAAFKAKRSRRHRPAENPPSEEEYLALCLVMLARGGSGDRKIPDPPLTHKCSVCDKGFSSYQALGGHKASHRKSLSDAAVETISSAAFAAANSGGRAHECTICHRSFPSGQALGGHKRRHYDGGSGGAAVTSSEGGGASTVSHGSLRHDFDLNLPALPEDRKGQISDVAVNGKKSQVYGEDEVSSPLPNKKPRLLLIKDIGN